MVEKVNVVIVNNAPDKLPMIVFAKSTFVSSIDGMYSLNALIKCKST